MFSKFTKLTGDLRAAPDPCTAKVIRSNCTARHTVRKILFSPFVTFRFADGKYIAEDYMGLRNYLSKKREWAQDVPLKILASAPDVGQTYWWEKSKTKTGIPVLISKVKLKDPSVPA